MHFNAVSLTLAALVVATPVLARSLPISQSELLYLDQVPGNAQSPHQLVKRGRRDKQPASLPNVLPPKGILKPQYGGQETTGSTSYDSAVQNITPVTKQDVLDAKRRLADTTRLIGQKKTLEAKLQNAERSYARAKTRGSNTRSKRRTKKTLAESVQTVNERLDRRLRRAEGRLDPLQRTSEGFAHVRASRAQSAATKAYQDGNEERKQGTARSTVKTSRSSTKKSGGFWSSLLGSKPKPRRPSDPYLNEAESSSRRRNNSAARRTKEEVRRLKKAGAGEETSDAESVQVESSRFSQEEGVPPKPRKSVSFPSNVRQTKSYKKQEPPSAVSESRSNRAGKQPGGQTREQLTEQPAAEQAQPAAEGSTSSKKPKKPQRQPTLTQQFLMGGQRRMPYRPKNSN